MPLPPSKLPLLVGGIWTSIEYMVPWAHPVLNPNGISIGAAGFAELTSVIDRQTTLLGR